jgi:transcriptional regulator of acetoin/glycerol metabolism
MTHRVRQPGNHIPPSPLPANPFFSTPEQRLGLARQRYFEEGVLPAAGTVGDAVLQSWMRCRTAGQEPSRPPEFNRVTRRLERSTVQFNRALIEAARNAMAHLQDTLAGTGVAAVLTDARGIVAHAAFTGQSDGETVIPLAARVGIDLSEAAAGTCAPAITTHTARACMVRGAEHFFHSAGMMHCAAWPIHDVHGRLAGVLSLFSENRAFAFDPVALVGMYAAAVENRLLRAQSAGHFLVQMAISPLMLDTPSEGLAGLTEDGRILWMNDDAARLLGQPGWQDAAPRPADGAPELDVRPLIGLAGRTEPMHLRLPNGLGVWVRSRAPSPRRYAVHAATTPRTLHADNAAVPASPSPSGGTPPQAASGSPDSLREADRRWIAQALEACGGNVSKAARRLGISRGRIYRHLKAGSQGLA